ncbi:unnamed protein product [Rhizophagus irregularis]|nr:unnamed protein product [Rhizophagus irregularis]
MNKNDNKDEIFLKEFMNKLFNTIIYNTNEFKENQAECLINSFKIINDKLRRFNDINDIVKLIQNHKNHDIWFSSLNGLFHQCGYMDYYYIDYNKCLNLYLLAIKNEEILKMIDLNIREENEEEEEYDDDGDDDDDNFEDYILQLKNVIIGKYLLSLFYYKEFIINKPLSIKKLDSNYDLIYNLTLQHLKDFEECRKKNSLEFS